MISPYRHFHPCDVRICAGHGVNPHTQVAERLRDRADDLRHVAGILLGEAERITAVGLRPDRPRRGIPAHVVEADGAVR